MTVVEAVERDLAEFPPEVARSAFAASALELARQMDAKNSATSKAMCSRALMDNLDRLRELHPVKEKVDDVSRFADSAQRKLRAI